MISIASYEDYTRIIDEYEAWLQPDKSPHMHNYRRNWMLGKLQAARHFVNQGDFARVELYLDSLDLINRLYGE